MMAMYEPEGGRRYVDQVPRRVAYEAAHPEVEIVHVRPYWQAVVREEDGGQTIITRYELSQLLDKLEAMSTDGPRLGKALPGPRSCRKEKSCGPVPLVGE